MCSQLRQLETQWERACEEKQVTLREKRDLEGLIAALCEQVRKALPSRQEHMPFLSLSLLSLIHI